MRFQQLADWKFQLLPTPADGNLHPTVEADDTTESYAAAEVVIDDITRLALDLGGTISGEHGIGLVKQAELPLQIDSATRHAQQLIKRLFRF